MHFVREESTFAPDQGTGWRGGGGARGSRDHHLVAQEGLGASGKGPGHHQEAPIRPRALTGLKKPNPLGLTCCVLTGTSQVTAPMTGHADAFFLANTRVRPVPKRQPSPESLAPALHERLSCHASGPQSCCLTPGCSPGHPV